MALKFGNIFINPANIFYESTLSFAFVDTCFVVPGHVLLTSKSCVPRVADMSQEEISDLFLTAQKVSSVIRDQYGASSITMLLQDGSALGQTINQVHLHLLPKADSLKEHGEICDEVEMQEHNLDTQLDSHGGLKFGNIFIESDNIFYESALSFAFVNIRCVLPGHVLVSSKSRVPHFAGMSKDEISDLFLTAQKVSSVIQEHNKASSITMVMQDDHVVSENAKQVHLHILPRRQNDFNENDDVHNKLEEHDHDIDKSVRSASMKNQSSEKMASEARRLKRYFR